MIHPDWLGVKSEGMEQTFYAAFGCDLQTDAWPCEPCPPSLLTDPCLSRVFWQPAGASWPATTARPGASMDKPGVLQRRDTFHNLIGQGSHVADFGRQLILLSVQTISRRRGRNRRTVPGKRGALEESPRRTAATWMPLCGSCRSNRPAAPKVAPSPPTRTGWSTALHPRGHGALQNSGGRGGSRAG